MIDSPPVLGLLGIAAVAVVIVLLKGHIGSIRKGEPFVIKSGVFIQPNHPIYRRLVALSMISYAVALCLSLVLIATVFARMEGFG